MAVEFENRPNRAPFPGPLITQEFSDDHGRK